MQSVSFVIAAYNEKANILNLLSDVVAQASQPIEGFFVERIIVVSDCSNDGTDNLVDLFGKEKDARIKLVRNLKRSGKMASLVDMFKTIGSDLVITLDADIRLDTECVRNLLIGWNTNEHSLVGGNPVPHLSSAFNRSIAEQASYFSWCLLREIKSERADSIFSAHGRILGLTKSLYKNMASYREVKAGTDRSMFLASNGNFKYIKNAQVFYKCPTRIQDYFKQALRYNFARSLSQDDSESFSSLEKIKIFTRAFVQEPLAGSCWIALRFTLKIWMIFKKEASPIDASWSVVASTK